MDHLPGSPSQQEAIASVPFVDTVQDLQALKYPALFVAKKKKDQNNFAAVCLKSSPSRPAGVVLPLWPSRWCCLPEDIFPKSQRPCPKLASFHRRWPD